METSSEKTKRLLADLAEIEEETLKNDDFHIGNSKISDEDTIITTGKVTKRINSIKREKDVQDMVSMIKTFLGFNGLVRARGYLYSYCRNPYNCCATRAGPHIQKSRPPY